MKHPISDPRLDDRRLSRRQCLGLFAASTLPVCALPGCALVNTESPYWATVAAVGGIAGGAPVTRAQADALPYASILAWFDGSPMAFMVLGEIGANGALFYYSQSRQVLVVQDGFIIQTVGMPGDLSRTRWAETGTRRFADLIDKDVIRYLDIQSAGLFDIEVRSHFVREASETVTILDRPQPLVRYREDVTMRGEKPYSNLYWIDADTGLCWKSRQRVHARLEPMNIEITKPVG